MYQNIFIKRNNNRSEIHIWDDTNGYFSFQYKPYAYKKSAAGIYRSLYGDKLKKVNYWERDDIEDGLIFESDVPIETRILVDNYMDSDESSIGHREMIFDIEVEVTDGFPDVSKADNKITAIALYDRIPDSYTALILGNVKNYIKDNVTVESFESEEELLQRFYQKYLEISPTIITGWNSDYFDIPYLYNRTEKVLGTEFANCLSPIGEVFWSENKGRYKIAGVSSMDYLRLYKLYNYTEKSSYRLGVIGEDEVGIGKIEFDGTLQNLYETDINKYIEYNLNDVIIVKELDDKLQFIELARGIAHKGHIPYEEVYHSSRYLEGAILTHLKKIDIVSPNKPSNEMNDDIRFVGAWVKDPVQGRHEWVYDLDLTSMYPSIIMTLNISPEMKIGKFDGWDSKEFNNGVEKTYSFKSNGKTIQMSNIDIKSIFENKEVSISSNGVMYKNDRKGLIPVILEKWFDERVEYKTLMKKFGNEGDNKKYQYFHRRQLVTKIMLNSLYGVLGLPVFRFYDLDNAGAVTTTGQELIKFTEKMGNHYYNEELGGEYEIELEDGSIKKLYGNTQIKVKRGGIIQEILVKDLNKSDDIIEEYNFEN